MYTKFQQLNLPWCFYGIDPTTTTVTEVEITQTETDPMLDPITNQFDTDPTQITAADPEATATFSNEILSPTPTVVQDGDENEEDEDYAVGNTMHGVIR